MSQQRVDAGSGAQSESRDAGQRSSEPSASRRRYRHVYQAPHGALGLEFDELGRLCRLSFLRRGLEWPEEEEPQEAARLAATAVLQLEEYFAGQRASFDLELHPEGTEFQQRVWAALLEIPAGETRGYGELARQLGKPGAARAVGLANGRNPIAIVIPCHRVIGADGSLTGFGGGLPWKKALLAHERDAYSKEPRQTTLPLG